MSGENGAAELERLVDVLAEVMDAAPFGFAVFDSGMRYRFVNRHLASVHGLAAREHVGRTMGELFPADHVDPVEPPIRDVLRTGIAHRDQEMALRVWGGDRDFIVNRYPLRAPGDEVIGVAVIVQDVTELRRASHEREDGQRLARVEAERRLSQVSRIGAVGVWDIDTLSGQVYWSPEMFRILGREPGRADPTGVVHPDDLSLARYHWSELVQGRPCTSELRLLRADGSAIVVVATGEPVEDDGGRVVSVRGTVLDVTELRSAQHAANRARIDREHHIRLQSSLLPTTIPEAGGLRIAVAYEPADNTAAIGGDFYDCFPLDDTRLAFTIGDVAGHTIESAAAMAQIRAAVRAYALDDPEPAAVIARVNRFVARSVELPITSLIYGHCTPRGRVTFANAGHLPPVIVTDGAAAPHPTRPAPILGATTDATWPVTVLDLPEGGTFFCYTDGLVERRDASLDARIDELCGCLAAADTSVDVLVRSALRILPREGHEDDVCVLAIHNQQ